ncbi:MAG: hypothetical protein PHR44_00495 [Candidatus Omnitrophica bacterium]|nr:hypothetical protein [Candidatus Omnitrophota bacterium]
MTYLGREQRRYIRLDSVFPVEFKLVDPGRDERPRRELSTWQQGFTSNVSKGGLCLAVNNLNPRLIGIISGKAVQLELVIHVPIAGKKVNALANIAWIEGEGAGEENTYSIGLSYQHIDAKGGRNIMRFAYTKALLPRLIALCIVLLIAAFSLSAHLNYKLIQTSKKLVDELVQVVQRSSVAKQKIKDIQRERAELESRLATAEFKLDTVMKRSSLPKDEDIAGLNQIIKQLEKEKADIQNKLIAVQDKEGSVTEDLLMMTEKMVVLERANLEKMYEWLRSHQNPRTGLVCSFEGDPSIEGWAFTYDQSLIAVAYTYFGDYERAEKILDFYSGRAKKIYGGFANAYYADDYEVAEYAVHTGPNIWVGIAAAHYTNMTGDRRYLKLAGEIADWVMGLQKEDRDNGLRGGPQYTWYATEHNLDAYAFLRMLYKITGNERYNVSGEQVFKWLKNHAYDKPEIPVKRGKGDSTIATDTYAWSIAAIGPQRLFEAGMDPDQILEFAKVKCLARTSFQRPDGNTLEVNGFDFGLSRRVGSCPVISTEWTAQMIISYRIMAKFYQNKNDGEKAKYYDKLANDYLTELTKLIITSDSRTGQGSGCLPYATSEFSDTGHGWMTPKGSRTGSVAGTTYALFAFNGFNPLRLEQE